MTAEPARLRRPCCRAPHSSSQSQSRHPSLRLLGLPALNALYGSPPLGNYGASRPRNPEEAVARPVTIRPSGHLATLPTKSRTLRCACDLVWPLGSGEHRQARALVAGAGALPVRPRTPDGLRRRPWPNRSPSGNEMGPGAASTQRHRRRRQTSRPGDIRASRRRRPHRELPGRLAWRGDRRTAKPEPAKSASPARESPR